MISVFIDTFVIVNITVFAILSTGAFNTGLTGTALTQAAFTSVMGGFGDIFIAICLFFFAFSTIIGWYFFGEQNIKYLFGTKAIKYYQAAFAIVIVIGCVSPIDIVWNIADTFNGLMAIPNFVGLFVLSGVVAKLTKEHFSDPAAMLEDEMYT